MRILRTSLVALAVAAAFLVHPANATERFITLQSTTSTQNSGLYDYLLPKFTAESGVAVRVVAVGTGQALRNAANGDADVLIVHARAAEEKFVADGFGVVRRNLMYNDFVLVGPSNDPAAVGDASGVGDALARIAAASAAFVSRGDNSGTHNKELALWTAAGVKPGAASGGWYRELGSGMGATLNTASAMGAYTLADRATWLKFANKGDLRIVLEGDSSLFNQYGVIRVNEARHAHIKVKEAQAFIDWLTGAAGQAAIAAYTFRGQPLFTPNAQ